MGTDDDPLPLPDPCAPPTRRRPLPGHLVPHLAVTTTLCTSWLVVALAGGPWFPWPLVAIAAWGLGLVLTRSSR